MQQLKIWIAMKLSTNLELNDPGLSGNECERAHTLTTTTTGSKNSQKEANNQTDYQSHNALSPQRSLLCRLLVLDEVKCKTHTQQSTSSTQRGGDY